MGAHLRAALLGAALALAAVSCGPSSSGDPSDSGGADELALEVAVSPSPPAVGDVVVEVRLRDADGEPVDGASLAIEGNMSHAGMVPSFGTATEVEPGVYSAPLELTMAGDWFLVISAELPDGRTVEETHQLPGVRPRD